VSDKGNSGHSDQRRLIGVLRVAFGLIWIVNIWFSVHGAYLHHFLAEFRSAAQGSPGWLQGWLGLAVTAVEGIGAHNAVLISVAAEVVIALTLLTGWWGRTGAWLGLLYCLFMWSTAGAFGGALAIGYTDPGPWPPYIVAFVVILELRAWEEVRTPGGPSSRPAGTSDLTKPPMIGQLLFGLLWAFEAYWKWQPYFLTHFTSYLLPAAAGQPAWIAGYIHDIIGFVKAVGPEMIGVITAVVETLIAVTLLTGRGLRYGLALGGVWSLAIWTTAEGWGGPYGPGFSSTAMSGDIFGNAINYAYVFALLGAALVATRSASEPVAPVKAELASSSE